MQRFNLKYILFFFIIVCALNVDAQTKETFDNPQTKFIEIGRGKCYIDNGVLKSKDSYAIFGNKELKNYTFSFKARAPKDAEQVQIWAGFRAHNRDDRYILGLKGGLQNDLYLSRMGYMGSDELLNIRSVDFNPVPGEWYKFKIDVCGNRIRVFLNDKSLPYIDVIDENSNLAPMGPITLGGGWIETEFDDLEISELQPNALDGINSDIYNVETTAQQKEEMRKSLRAMYEDVTVEKLENTRSTISLNGNWLFMPDYDMKDVESGANPTIADDKWHVMNVPDFWNPIRIWLHGENMEKHLPKGVSDTYYQKETERCESYTFNYKKTKAAWYRQWIKLPENIKGKNVELTFDAISKMADIYVNGTLAKSNVGMFGEIKTDISSLIKPGKNLIAVYVTRDYITNIENADEIVDVAVTVPVTNRMLKDIAHGFYKEDPAGIWQPVSLTISEQIKVEDVFIKPSLDGATFDITVKNNKNKKVSFSLATDILEYDTNNLFYSEESLKNIELKPNEESVLTYEIKNLNPRLWAPHDPNLYNFSFKIYNKNGIVDEVDICSGFRTFEVKDGLLYLNDKPYWLRGGNHTPFALAPNDITLANSFYQIMKAGNIEITRTHTTPYNKLWIDAADKNGIGISHEGTWPWLMILESMPDQILIDMWAKEYLSLLKKYRNHPSILFWTINNEMKFYDNDPDVERRKKKMTIISDVVKQMRIIDPTRPICFDSNYRRNERKQGSAFYTNIDDGDIDDIHSYVNWYHSSVFQQFNGEFQKHNKNQGRPLISQEMSTGYPNSETGHPTRFYTLTHQNPQALVGYQAYPYGDPNLFLNVQSFISGELAEALRRSNENASGILHFALLTWFRNVYDAQNIEPYPTYYAMKRALQPILVSAELWGRNFYAGDQLPVQVYVVNDRHEGTKLTSSILHWSLETEMGEVLIKGKSEVPEVEYYGRKKVIPFIKIPDNLSLEKQKAKLKLRLTENGINVSENEYNILLANKTWITNTDISKDKKIILVDNNNISDVFDMMKMQYQKVNSISDALKIKSSSIVISGDNADFDDSTKNQLRNFMSKGGKVVILNNEDIAKKIFPEYILDWIKPTEGDIVNMEIPESEIFNAIDLLDLRYFNNQKREIPTVCHSAFKINRNENIIGLANQTKIHGYIRGNMQERKEYVETIKGFPILKISEGKGSALISTMAHEKASTDPIAARLLFNIISSSIQ